MCELLAMSSRLPARLTLSLDAFASHGGHAGPHRDGWGIAFLHDNDVQLVREARASSDSAQLAFLRGHDLRSTQVLAHLRLATRGERSLRNTQPFLRELGGRVHLFAHNGDLADLAPPPAGARFRALGDTDSEFAFCRLLERLAPLWDAPALPPLEARLAAVAAFAADLRPRGPANFVYADGLTLFAHGHRRTQADGAIRPPGLHLLQRHCTAGSAPPEIDGVALERPDAPQDVALVTSVPLSDEAWRPLDAGEVVALEHGAVAERVAA
ncbi:MAG: class II glutamine amidotransferase [Gammaproteobacteria bacterium]|nr:class II glutamine amidotransferase [Gammaproteobacteria bacterium]